ISVSETGRPSLEKESVYASALIDSSRNPSHRATASNRITMTGPSHRTGANGAAGPSDIPPTRSISLAPSTSATALSVEAPPLPPEVGIAIGAAPCTMSPPRPERSNPAMSTRRPILGALIPVLLTAWVFGGGVAGASGTSPAVAIPTNVNVSRMLGNQAETSIAISQTHPKKMTIVSNIDVGDGLFHGWSTDSGT